VLLIPRVSVWEHVEKEDGGDSGQPKFTWNLEMAIQTEMAAVRGIQMSQLTYLNKVFVVISEQEIVAALTEISSRDHSAYDAFVLVILSHGNKDGVYGIDGSSEPAKDARRVGFVLLDEITALFDGSKCESLRGKPKMFIIQACQGGVLRLRFVADYFLLVEINHINLVFVVAAILLHLMC